MNQGGFQQGAKFVVEPIHNENEYGSIFGVTWLLHFKIIIRIIILVKKFPPKSLHGVILIIKDYKVILFQPV